MSSTKGAIKPYFEKTSITHEKIIKISRYKAVAYDRLSVVLLEAIKEQQKQIEDMKAQIANLNNKKMDK